jgi:hypothetical protein
MTIRLYQKRHKLGNCLPTQRSSIFALRLIFYLFKFTSSSKFHTYSNQIVTLEAVEGAPRARILGITRDWAFLRAEEIDDQDQGTGKMHELQPDGNSFDFWKGLVTRKA